MTLSPWDRKKAVKTKRVKLAAIAEQLGVTGPHVSQVLWGLRRSPRVERAIADALDLPVEEVFPPVEQSVA